MIEKVVLGSTGIWVSRLGLGTVKFGRTEGVRYPEQFDLPTDKQILELLDYAQRAGINLLDTAPAYGLSEERLGKLLKGKRHEWIICSKAGEEFNHGQSHYDFSSQAIRLSLERSLSRLNTDVIDILLIHSNGEDQKIIHEHHVFDVLADLKKSGLIRAFGMSTKTVEGGRLTVDHADVAMVTYNFKEQREAEVIDYAKSNNKSIFIKKALGSGHLATESGKTTEEALRFVYQKKGVTSVILGTINPTHLAQNINSIILKRS